MSAEKKNRKIIIYNKPWGMKEEEDYNIPLSDGFELSTEHRYIGQAEAMVFHMPTLSIDNFARIKDKKLPGQLWVFWSLECELHYLWQYSQEIQDLFDIKATYKTDSDIPLNYIRAGYKEALRTPAIKKTELINAFISSGFDLSNRGKHLTELMKHIEVHSFGKLLNNKEIVNDDGVDAKLNTISRYKFSLAFENAIAKDYVTEKLYQPLIAGSVPIYLGAPNVDEFVPGDNCYINVEAFQSVKHLADYILELNYNDEQYQKFFYWKTLPFRDAFNNNAAVSEIDPLKRLCDLINFKIRSGVI